MAWRRWGVAACFVCAGCAEWTEDHSVVPVKRAAWEFDGSPGTEITSAHYDLHTTCRDDRFLEYIPQFLEACWTRYESLLPTDRAPDEPLTTYLFLKRWEWERFTERFSPARAATYKRIRSGGYTERGITVSHYSTRRGALSVLAHEGLHQYLERTRGKPIPAWLNEGLACYFEGFDLDARDRPVFTPALNPLRSSALRETLARKQMIPLRDILNTHAGREVHKQSRHVRSYYAQEWSLVLYLLEPAWKNPYHDGFRRLLKEVGTESMRRMASAYLAADTDGTMGAGEAIFRAYITDDLETFEEEYERFMRDLLGLSF